MRLSKRVILSALATVAFCAGGIDSAKASSYFKPPPDDTVWIQNQAWVNKSLRIAFEHFKIYPSACTSIAVGQTLTLPEKIVAAAPQGPLDQGDCYVIFNRDWVPYIQSYPIVGCTYMAHEFGHLVGHGHTDEGDPDPVMKAVDPPFLAACVDAFTKAPRAAKASKRSKSFDLRTFRG